LKFALLNVLCNLHGDPSYHGLPSSPSKLFTVLKEDYDEILKIQTLSSFECSMLVPSDGKTVLESLPVPLILKLISIVTPYTHPVHPLCDEQIKGSVQKAISFVLNVPKINHPVNEKVNLHGMIEQAIVIMTDLKAFDQVKGQFVQLFILSKHSLYLNKNRTRCN